MALPKAKDWDFGPYMRSQVCYKTSNFLRDLRPYMTQRCFLYKT